MAPNALGVTWAMKLTPNIIINCRFENGRTNKLEIQDDELVIAVLFARVLVENISAG